MPARTPGNAMSKHPSLSMDLEQQHAGVIGNEQLTALVSLVLLVLIIVNWSHQRSYASGSCVNLRTMTAKI